MFVVPAFLSITLDVTQVIVYLRQGELFGLERHAAWAHLLDVSACNFDLALLAALRVLVLCPYIYSYAHRRRLVYTTLPWVWEALNMAVVTARLVFLLSAMVGFDAQYFLVVLSFASIVLQAVCLEHLRSSAPREKRIFLAGNLNRIDASTRLLDSHGSVPGGGGELYAGHQQDVDFIATITAKMKRAKEYWTDKTEALRVLWNDLSRNRGEEAAPFNLLLRLFTYEDVLGDLDEAFAHDPASIEFYIPQLVTFLLYGAFWSSGSLQAFLLDKSARSIQFAHRLYWFLQASCLDGSGINPEGRRQVTALLEDVKTRGQKAAQRLEDGHTLQELHPPGSEHGPHPHHPHPGRNHAHQRWGRGTASQDSRDPSKDGRASSANTTTSSLSFGGGGGAGGGDGERHTYVDVAQLQNVVTPGSSAASSPVDALLRGAPTSPRAPPTFPLELGSYKGEDGDLFGVLPRFLDALIVVSRDLMGVPRDRRNAILRVGLQDLGQRFLPSNLIYMPVGNPYHRVWRIHGPESFAFSTRERVPCLVCLEVVDYAHPPRRGGGGKGKKWWKNMMGVESLPAISHTFKFGNKEWTLKIGEPKKDSEGGEGAEAEEGADADTTRRLLAAGAAAPSSSAPSLETPLLPAALAPPPSTPTTLMRRMSSSGGLATIDGSSTGGMGQWASEEEAAGGAVVSRSGSEHLLLNVSQLRRAAQQQQEDENRQHAVVTPQDEDSTTISRGVAEEKEGTAVPTTTTTGEHYGTFSPGNSPGGSRRAPHGGDVAKSSSTPPPKPASTRRSSNSSSGGEQAGGVGMSPATAAAQAPVIFKERWKQKEHRIRRRSQIGHLPGWRLVPVIVKANDDLRQEQFASQLLHQIDHILREAEIPVWMRPYDIVATSFDGGLIEAIPDTVSLDALRRNDPHYTTLPDFFDRLFGSRPHGEAALEKARQCFVESLAAYSIVCFLLQIKDRHNGNILLDAEGHLIHIDFGFMLARSPGNVNFERAPFKLTSEMVDIMEGPLSPYFRRFRELCVKTFLELRRQRHKIILLVEMVVNGNETLACFGDRPQATVEALRQRFQPELNDRACADFVNGLIDQSLGNWRTRAYDMWQGLFVL